MINNKIKNKKENKKEKSDGFAAASALLSECEGYGHEVAMAMNRFLSMRKEIGKPVKSKQAATMLLNRLKRLSEEDAAHMVLLLDKATERQWLSLYALREDEQPMPPWREVDTSGVRFL